MLRMAPFGRKETSSHATDVCKENVDPGNSNISDDCAANRVFSTGKNDIYINKPTTVLSRHYRDSSKSLSPEKTRSMCPVIKETSNDNSRVKSKPYLRENDPDYKFGMKSSLIFETMLAQQNIYRAYVPSAKYLRSRRVLVDWIADMCSDEKFRLARITQHVAVMYLDRVLQRLDVPRERLTLVAACCLLVAAKYEEMETTVPTLYELVQVTNHLHRECEFIEMETCVLDCLNWKLTEFPPLSFLEYFLHKGILFENDSVQGLKLFPKVERHLRCHVYFFADFTQQRYDFEIYSSSIVATAIIIVSRKALQIAPLWREELTDLTRCGDMRQAMACADAIALLYRKEFPENSNVKMPSTTARYGKYQRKKSKSPDSVTYFR
eukprot:g1180.t1